MINELNPYLIVVYSKIIIIRCAKINLLLIVIEKKTMISVFIMMLVITMTMYIDN